MCVRVCVCVCVCVCLWVWVFVCVCVCVCVWLQVPAWQSILAAELGPQTVQCEFAAVHVKPTEKACRHRLSHSLLSATQ